MGRKDGKVGCKDLRDTLYDYDGCVLPVVLVLVVRRGTAAVP
jgi:hypothetical protein